MLTSSLYEVDKAMLTNHSVYTDTYIGMAGVDQGVGGPWGKTVCVLTHYVPSFSV